MAMIDVLVIGGGNAALCAALMAREAGAQRAAARSRTARLARRQLDARAQPALHARRAAGRADRGLLRGRVLAGPAEGHRRADRRGPGAAGDPRTRPRCRDWMRSHGVHFQPPLSGALHVARTNAFFMGGGKALVNAYYRSAEAARRADSLRLAGRRDRARRTAASSPRASAASASRRAACVLAAGGFESQPCMAARGLGPERARRMAGRQLPDPRHALQPGRAAEVHARCRSRRDRRPDAGALRRHRRARAALRRRHLHPHRLRFARRGGQPRGDGASTTRARTSGPSATPSGAGWSPSSRGRSRYSIIDAKAIGRFMPPVFAARSADTLPELAPQARA